MYKLANLIATGIAATMVVMFACFFFLACGDHRVSADTDTAKNGNARAWMKSAVIVTADQN